MGEQTRDDERRSSLAPAKVSLEEDFEEEDVDKGNPKQVFKKELKKFRSDAEKALPSYFRKLTGIYAYRVFWFEIFECAAGLDPLGLLCTADLLASMPPPCLVSALAY